MICHAPCTVYMIFMQIYCPQVPYSASVKKVVWKVLEGGLKLLAVVQYLSRPPNHQEALNNSDSRAIGKSSGPAASWNSAGAYWWVAILISESIKLATDCMEPSCHFKPPDMRYIVYLYIYIYVHMCVIIISYVYVRLSISISLHSTIFKRAWNIWSNISMSILAQQLPGPCHFLVVKRWVFPSAMFSQLHGISL